MAMPGKPVLLLSLSRLYFFDMQDDFSRRDVLLRSLAMAAFTPIGRAIAFAAETPRLVDAGEVSKYAEEGIYPEFQPLGFFVITRVNRIVAQSSLCTHKKCKLKARPEGFSCSCHGSTFDVDGKVTQAPAKKDLPRHPVRVENGRLLVDTKRMLERDAFGERDAYVDTAAV